MMPIKKILDFYNRHPSFGYVFLTIFSAVFFGIIQANGALADPDAFYHAKMAILMARQGIVHNFPWLVYTVLPQIYTDHHFLYHVILVPFVWKLPPLLGIKIATSFINTIFVLLFYGFLRKNGIRRPLFFVFLLLSAVPFIFRIDLAKANGLSLVFVMLILICLFRGRRGPAPRSSKSEVGWLAFLSFLYVWSYGGWPLSIFIAGVYLVASVIAHHINEGKPARGMEWRPLAATALGSLSGLIINPYFPQNLKFYWIQIMQIAVLNYQTKIGVGAEWYKFDLAELVTYSGPVLLVLMFGLLFFFGRIFIIPPPRLPLSKGEVEGVSYEVMKNIFFFVFLSGAFFILTLKSCRNTEYFFPFAIMAAAFIWKYFWDKDLFKYFRKKFLEVFKKDFFYLAFVVYIFLMFILSFGLNFWRVKSVLAQGFSFDYYQKAMEAAKNNSRAGDIIFHSDWDDWPMLFYHNDYNRYIVGLDTTFMYKYSPEFYKKWRDITWGDYKGDVYPVIKNDFHAAIIFIAQNDIEIVDKYFKNDGRFEPLYDKEGKVYKVK